MINEEPKNLTFAFLNGATETVLTTDPIGWEGQSVMFPRGDDFGINADVTVPFQFTNENRDYLKSVWEATGVFSVIRLKIYKKNNDWTTSLFYEYEFDFTTYSDDFSKITLEGKEVGLLSAFKANVDTVFDIDLGEDGVDLIYEASKYKANNLLQIVPGTCDSFAPSSPAAFFRKIKGSRAVRSYTTELSFTDTSLNPYTSLTARALKDGLSFDIHTRIDSLVVRVSSASLTPTRGDLVEVDRYYLSGVTEYNTGWRYFFGDIPTPANHVHPTSVSLISDDGYNFTVDVTFSGIDRIDNTGVINASTEEKIHVVVSSFYYAPTMVIQTTTDIDNYLEVDTLTDRQYTGGTLKCFTHNWAIEKILEKIYPSATLDYNFPIITDLAVGERGGILLSSTTCFIKYNGGVDTVLTVPLKLSDLLKSLDVLYCIGIDITGNVLTLDYRENFYLPTAQTTYQLVSNNIKLSQDTKHQFSKIVVGWNSKDQSANGLLAFNTKNQYNVANAVSEQEYNIVSPFIGDMYSIDEIILGSVEATGDELAKKKSKENADIVLFDAYRPDLYTFAPYKGQTSMTNFKGDMSTAYNVALTPERLLLTHRDYISISAYLCGVAYPVKFASCDINSGDSGISTTIPGEYYETVVERSDMSVNTDPMFLPVIVEFETAVDIDNLEDIKTSKYKYYSVTHEKTGEVINGHVNSAGFKIGKNQTQQWVLQRK